MENCLFKGMYLNPYLLPVQEQEVFRLNLGKNCLTESQCRTFSQEDAETDLLRD